MKIGFLKRGINLIFSKTKEGDNIVFSSLRYENDLIVKKEEYLYTINSFNYKRGLYGKYKKKRGKNGY